MVQKLRLRVNGAERAEEVEPRLLLVHYLREVCGLTGQPRGLRHQPVRRLHRASERCSGEVVQHAGGPG